MAINRGIATFTLDDGRCPKWLFRRMVRLGREMARAIVSEYGPDDFIKRISDPAWFQSLGTVLAFDWNASGLTTILTAALKEAILGEERELGIFICGGKGRVSRRTPEEITAWGNKLGLEDSQTKSLVYNSRMTAKVDSALIQDGYQIYHHAFFFSRNGAWTVVQQGMNTESVTARRYHWFSENINDLVCEPHTAIVSDARGQMVLDLTSKESTETRKLSIDLVGGNFYSVYKDIELLRKHSSSLSRALAVRAGEQTMSFLELENTEFHDHPVAREDFSKSSYLAKILWKVCESKPKTYEELLALIGVGPKTVRALALVSEVIYGAKPSYEDPARYSFAHGGKDATPYPVDRKTYDETINMMRVLVNKTKLGLSEKQQIQNRLNLS